MSVIYLDGEFVASHEATVSVFDHGLLYGDGVFEGIRAYNGRVFRLEEHIRRLFDSAKAIILDIGMSQAEVCAAVVETCRRNEIRDGYIRVVVTRGPGDLGLDPRKCSKPTVFVIAAAIQLYPERCYTEGLRVVTCATRRNHPQALDPSIKSLNYLNNILAKIEVNRAGADEGLMLNAEGWVAEATGDNIFVMRDGQIYTPPVAAGCLRGITRDTVIELAQAAGLPLVEEFFSLHFVYTADEIFLTGSAAEVVPVTNVDERVIGDGRPGPISRQLVDLYRDYVAHNGTPIGT
ncbi:MAG TPA: branched-chain amino acid aminotransferase [Armatimonadetes bacterium]|nr:branched-chain amino acid aminotransferase [Armatimonadota bacterium]